MTFSCTNTTYLDINGNAQGVTIFIATDCSFNNELPSFKQDPRYLAFTTGDTVLEDRLSDQFASEIRGYPLTANDFSGPEHPAVLPTCLRGCLCGYSAGWTFPNASVYSYCDCALNLALEFAYLANMATPVNGPILYTTPTNLSLLAHYNISYNDFNASITKIDLGMGRPVWENISEGSNLTLQRGFECFGDYETIAEIIPPQSD